jgi:hypothetical protein
MGGWLHEQVTTIDQRSGETATAPSLRATKYYRGVLAGAELRETHSVVKLGVAVGCRAQRSGTRMSVNDIADVDDETPMPIFLSQYPTPASAGSKIQHSNKARSGPIPGIFQIFAVAAERANPGVGTLYR